MAILYLFDGKAPRPPLGLRLISFGALCCGPPVDPLHLLREQTLLSLYILFRGLPSSMPADLPLFDVDHGFLCFFLS